MFDRANVPVSILVFLQRLVIADRAASRTSPVAPAAVAARAKISASCWIITRWTIRAWLKKMDSFVRDGLPLSADYSDENRRVNLIVPQDRTRLMDYDKILVPR